MTSPLYDVAIAGAGIVGLATGLALLKQRPSLRLVLLEKEADVAGHQTGHNSGVIHAGLYYRPGSLKAQLCTLGARRLTEFCDEQGIAYQRCGKVIVATNERELTALTELHRRGVANGVPGLRWLSGDELREIEPHSAGQAGLHSPHTGIVDYRQVAQAMAAVLRQRGAEIRTQAALQTARPDGPHLRLETAADEVAARNLVNCAGLYADVIARRLGVAVDLQIVPFRGEYYFLRPDRQHLVRGLIYPVPDPRLPFLGVHFTRSVDGRVEAGPNAVLALAREGYTRWRCRPGELWQTLTYPGFWSLARRFWRTGAYEYYRSFSKAAFVRSLQRLLPAVQAADLATGGSGVRAQAIAPDGRLVDDFHIIRTRNAIHVLNAPSPAATASLAIGEYIARTAEAAWAAA